MTDKMQPQGRDRNHGLARQDRPERNDDLKQLISKQQEQIDLLMKLVETAVGKATEKLESR